MDILQNILVPFTNLYLLLMIAIGTFAGIYIGAIPGLSVTMAAVLLISLTFSWDILPALALIIGVYFGGVYGGSRAAILMNIPGAPSAIATTFDGYPLSQKGDANVAIGLATIFSVLGGLFGVVVLATGAPLVSSFALSFAQRDYFLLAVLGLLLVGSLSQGSLPKAIFVAGIGVLLGLVGMDSMTGVGKFTFDSVTLMSGVNFIAALLGLFGLSEVFYQMRQLKLDSTVVKKMGTKIIPPFRLIFKYLPLSIRVSILGVLTGALPGVGGEIAALLAYDHAKKTVKNPSRPFGEGAYEGVIAPETANNAAIGGALIPLLTLGIPGDAVTAIILGALFIHGLRPGPMLMTESPDLFGFIIGAGILANIFLLIFGLTGIKVFTNILKVKKEILLPIIALITVVGAYSINNSIGDIYWMLGFGILGYIMKLNHFAVGPMVLGIILGPIIDVSFRRAVMLEEGNLLQLLTSFFIHPISLVLTIALIITILSQCGFSFSQISNKIKSRK